MDGCFYKRVYIADFNYPDKTNNNGNFKRFFSQIRLRLNKRRREQKLLELYQSYNVATFFAKFRTKYHTKIVFFGFF